MVTEGQGIPEGQRANRIVFTTRGPPRWDAVEHEKGLALGATGCEHRVPAPLRQPSPVGSFFPCQYQPWHQRRQRYAPYMAALLTVMSKGRHSPPWQVY